MHLRMFMCLHCSIGMVSSKRLPPTQTVLPLSPNVLLYQTKASSTNFRSRIKRYRSLLAQLWDIDRLTCSLFQGTFWYHSHFRNQYCDGLRGALVIEDPNDPQKHLYDVDNGEILICGDLIIRLRSSSRRYRYHTRGLVPLSFDRSSRYPVSLTASRLRQPQ